MWYNPEGFGAWLSLVERSFRVREVGSSNLPAPMDLTSVNRKPQATGRFFFLLLLFLLCIGTSANSSSVVGTGAGKALVRVWLSSINPAGATVSGDALQSLTSSGWKSVQGGSLKPAVTPGTDIQLRSGKGALLRIDSNNKVFYTPGVLRIVNVGGQSLCIVELPIEDYVSRVLASEMPARFPAEALKAQSVAIRSYVLSNHLKHRSQLSDVCDTSCCQNYSKERVLPESITKACQETRGVILRYQGRPFTALYSSSCGGTPSPFSLLARTENGPSSCPYCSVAPCHSWRLSLTQDELLKVLSITGSSYISAIKVLTRDTSGRLDKVRIDHENGTLEITSKEIRKLLGTSRLRSLLVTFEASENTGEILISGKGFGHGTGMCQWGASGMALPPNNKTFRDILSFYYPGVEIGVL